MARRSGRYDRGRRRNVGKRQLQVVKRVGQGIVFLIGFGSTVISYVSFGFSWTAVAFILFILALLVSLLANVLLLMDVRLNRARPKRIAFLAPSSGGQPFYAAMLTGLVQSASLAQGQDYIILPSMPTRSFESMSIWSLFASLEDRQFDIDGIIFIPDDPDRHFDEIVGFHEETGDVPLLLVDVYFDLAACDARTRARLPSFVGGDESAGGRVAAEIIIDALGALQSPPVVLVINGGTAAWERQRVHSFRERVRREWSATQFIESPSFNYSRSAAFAYSVELFKSMATAEHMREVDGLLKCPPCPRCDRIDRVAKVTGMVTRGTQQSTSSTWKSSSSFDEDGNIELLFNYSELTTTKRSLLVQQLTFPTKGQLFLDYIHLSVFLLVFAFVLVVIVMNSNPTAYDIEITDKVLAVLIPITVIILPTWGIAADIYYRGRKEAKKLWDTLYYCFRDDVVYAAHDITRCAPPDMMRAVILNY